MASRNLRLDISMFERLVGESSQHKPHQLLMSFDCTPVHGACVLALALHQTSPPCRHWQCL